LVILVCTLALATMTLAVYSAIRAQRAADERGRNLDPAATAAANLLADFGAQESAVRGYLFTADTRSLAPYEAATVTVPATFGRLGSLLADHPTLTVELKTIIQVHRRWLEMVALPELDAMRRGDSEIARNIERSGSGQAYFDDLRHATVGLQTSISAAQASSAGRVENAQDLLLSSIGTAVLLVALLAAAIVGVARYWLLRPIAALRRAVNAVAAGRYDTQIPEVGPAEILELAGNVERMRAQLVQLVRLNDRSWEALTQEGQAVLALRDALAPTDLRAPGLVVRGHLDPAEGELAGDWFDSFELPDGRVALVVGDVSGHGAAAGVFALRIKQLLAAALTEGQLAGEAVEWTVDRLGDTDEVFATAVVMVIDPGTGIVEYANAGHPDMLIIRSVAGAVAPVPPNGPLMSSIVSGPGSWPTASFRLAPSDALFVCTDGLIEARDAANREFGHERIIDEIMRDPRREAAELLSATLEAVRRFSPGRATDDRTAIVLARVPRAAGGPVPRARSGSVSARARGPERDLIRTGGARTIL
jgi:sigma-B regulation protein RsbU (phosphoserine phosphatase)